MRKYASILIKSISSLQPPTARVMPTLYQHRVGISLYDAQYSSTGDRQPIDDKTIAGVIAAFKHFKTVCSDFGVPQNQSKVLATEATRTAMNSEVFRNEIKEAVGWEVEMMPKEKEGEVGAMGIASSLPEVQGLVCCTLQVAIAKELGIGLDVERALHHLGPHLSWPDTRLV